MKALLLLTVSLMSVSALAQDLKCEGPADLEGHPGKITVTYNQKEGLTVAEAQDDGMRSGSVNMDYRHVQHWKEGIVPVIGVAPGIKIFLHDKEHASIRRLEGWGTGNPNGDFADLHCE